MLPNMHEDMALWLLIEAGDTSCEDDTTTSPIKCRLLLLLQVNNCVMTGVVLSNFKDPACKGSNGEKYGVWSGIFTQPYLQMSGLSRLSFCISPAVLSAIMGMVSCCLLVSVLPPVRMLSNITTVRVAAKALSNCGQQQKVASVTGVWDSLSSCTSADTVSLLPTVPPYTSKDHTYVLVIATHQAPYD